MRYWVLIMLLTPSDKYRASVVGPMTRAQFTQKYGNLDNSGNFDSISQSGYATKLEAAGVASKFNTGSQTNAGPVDTPVTQGLGSITNPLSGINAIGDFFNRLTQPNTWVRVGEVLAGALLVYMAGSAVLRGTPVAATAQTVKRGAKTAAKIGAAAA